MNLPKIVKRFGSLRVRFEDDTFLPETNLIIESPADSANNEVSCTVTFLADISEITSDSLLLEQRLKEENTEIIKSFEALRKENEKMASLLKQSAKATNEPKFISLITSFSNLKKIRERFLGND